MKPNKPEHATNKPTAPSGQLTTPTYELLWSHSDCATTVHAIGATTLDAATFAAFKYAVQGFHVHWQTRAPNANGTQETRIVFRGPGR